jgi:hypothetical protein
MHNEKSYFGAQNGSLAICHIGPWWSSSMSLCTSLYNMAAPLSTCTVEQQRRVICFLWSEGVKPSEIYRKAKVQYGNSWVRGECMNGWKDFKTEDKTSVNTRVGDQLAWQLRQWNSRSSSESVTTGESLTMKLPQHSTWVTALCTILSMMALGIGKCPKAVVWWSQACTADDLSGAFYNR